MVPRGRRNVFPVEGCYRGFWGEGVLERLWSSKCGGLYDRGITKRGYRQGRKENEPHEGEEWFKEGL